MKPTLFLGTFHYRSELLVRCWAAMDLLCGLPLLAGEDTLLNYVI